MPPFLDAELCRVFLADPRTESPIRVPVPHANPQYLAPAIYVRMSIQIPFANRAVERYSSSCTLKRACGAETKKAWPTPEALTALRNQSDRRRTWLVQDLHFSSRLSELNDWLGGFRPAGVKLHKPLTARKGASRKHET